MNFNKRRDSSFKSNSWNGVQTDGSYSMFQADGNKPVERENLKEVMESIAKLALDNSSVKGRRAVYVAPDATGL